MSSLTHPYSHGLDWAPSNTMKRLKNLLEGFFKSKVITKVAKIYHGKFSYELVPDTAIKDFYNIKKVTSIESGDCYLCVFERSQYQGQYQIISPGERAELGDCGSIIVSTQTFSVDAVKNDARLPAGFWELSGPMYIFFFSSGYRYV